MNPDREPSPPKYEGFTSDFENSSFFKRAIPPGTESLSILRIDSLPQLNSDCLKHINLWDAASIVGQHRNPFMEFSNGNNNIKNQNANENELETGESSPNASRRVEAKSKNLPVPRRLVLIHEDEYNSLLAQFCRHTSLHGLKYIGQRRVHIIEKLFWSIAFTLAIVIAAYMIGEVWQKYKRSPVIVSFQPTKLKARKLKEKNSITICNMNKVLKSKAESFMRYAKGPAKLQQVEEARENVYFMEHVCSASLSFSKKFNYSVTRGVVPETLMNQILNGASKIDADAIDVSRFLQISSQKCVDMIPLCLWQEQVENCTDLFSFEATDFGKCCSFNMIPKKLLYRYGGMDILRNEKNDTNEVRDWKAWTWDGDNLLGPKREEDAGDFPRRQKLPGKTFGLSLLLNPDLHEYFCTTSDSVGFRLLAHSPIEVPRVVDFGNAIPPNSEVFINVRPTITIADEKIQGFTLDQRQCYFSDEFKLLFYSYYTSTNCLMECVANLTFEKCRCATYYMPRDSTRDLCSRSQSKCAAKIQTEMIRHGQKALCRQCLPSCTEIKYRTEMTSTPLQNPEVLWESGAGANKLKWSRSNTSIVHIYFGDESTTSRLRTELYGIIDLFANFGGVMSFCMGFSGLSLIEIIYFMTLRAFCRRRHIHPQ